jgi:hypothetical protein
MRARHRRARRPPGGADAAHRYKRRITGKPLRRHCGGETTGGVGDNQERQNPSRNKTRAVRAQHHSLIKGTFVVTCCCLGQNKPKRKLPINQASKLALKEKKALFRVRTHMHLTFDRLRMR